VSVYNTLLTKARCPHCEACCEVRADFRFGLRDLLEYRVGDPLVWEGRGVRTPATRPPGGDYMGEAYTECPNCSLDYWLVVTVENDVIVSAATDLDREDYGREP
jgi:hypothetical protein